MAIWSHQVPFSHMAWRIRSPQSVRQVPVLHSPKTTSPSTIYFWFLMWLAGYDLLENLPLVYFWEWQHNVVYGRSVIEVSTAFHRRTQYLLLLLQLTWEILFKTIHHFKGCINFGKKKRKKKKKYFSASQVQDFQEIQRKNTSDKKFQVLL